MNAAAILNKLVNHPEIVREVAPGFSEVDMSAFFQRPDNFFIGDEKGGVLLAGQGNHVYELHYLFTYAKRGSRALRSIASAFDWAFTELGAVAIVGTTPSDNLAARRVNRALGGVAVGEGIDSFGRPCTHYRLDRATWAALSAESSEASEASLAPINRRRLQTKRLNLH